jgi:hypothetical protein
MNLLKPEQELPPEGMYVLARHNRTNWVAEDQEGCLWVVVCLEKGISKQERESLPNSDKRKRLFKQGDEEGNNLRPYAWHTFGPSSFFGQEIDAWCHLPRSIT